MHRGIKEGEGRLKANMANLWEHGQTAVGKEEKEKKKPSTDVVRERKKNGKCELARGEAAEVAVLR